MGEMPLRPPAATEYAGKLDVLFFALVILTVLSTALVLALIIAFVARYQRGNNVDRSNPSSHNTWLELAWTLPALVLGIGIFIWAAQLFAAVYQPPKNAKEIYVIGKQWMWHMQHANGVRENNELHLPVGEPVKLTMISQDVIHAFYVPEFRVQRQVQPGEYTQMWFTPNAVGKYHIYCNMYCGTQHSEMGGWVYVMTRADYDRWAAGGGVRAANPGGIEAPRGGLSLAQQGKALYEKFQCAGCHGSGGSDATNRGPSLAGIFGKKRQLTGNRVVEADDAYLRNAILYPEEYSLAGWPQGMPTYKGVLSEADILAVNAYIKTIGTKDEPHGGTPAQESLPADTENQQFRYMYGGEQYR